MHVKEGEKVNKDGSSHMYIYFYHTHSLFPLFDMRSVCAYYMERGLQWINVWLGKNKNDAALVEL